MGQPLTNISIYGAGNFGYSILKHLDDKGGDLRLKVFDRNEKLMQSLADDRRHLFFHQSEQISERVELVDSPSSLMTGAQVLILAITSDATREVLNNIKSHIESDTIIVNTAKALDYQTGKRLSQIVSEELGDMDYTYAQLAGGTIAEDLFKRQPLGVDIACQDKRRLESLLELFASSNLHVYGLSDLAGVEYAGAFKNVISILAGMVNGLGFSYGAETHVISSTAQLMADAAVDHLGAQPETFSMGRQCWGNDLWMSCTGPTRNRELGVLLGRGLSVDEAIATMEAAHKTVEGINTVKILNRIEPIAKIEQVELLHELIIKKSINISNVKDYLIRTHLQEGGA